MKNIMSHYMGIEINNPIILGASNMSKNIDSLKKAEELGVGAIVYKSLFEEQIQLERFKMDEELTQFNDMHAEMITIHPRIEHAGPEEHLNNLRKTKEALSIPLIASLNAVNDETWVKYAKLINETGVDGIELNFYQIPADFEKESGEIEANQVRIVNEIKNNISIPVSVKLSSDYSNTLNFIKKLDQAGVDGVVLFNSFFQPDIDIVSEKHLKSFNLSHEGDYKKSLRYSGLLYNNVKTDVCSSHGIFTGADVIKLILSGSSCVQIVSTLYKNGLSQISKIRNEMEEWMDSKNYKNIDEFRGKLSRNNLSSNPFVYKRAQYVDLILNSDDMFGKGN